MVYLITQILVILLFTAALALIAGWLLRGVGLRPQIEALERERDDERRRAAAIEARVAEARQTAAPAMTGTLARPGLVQSRAEPAAANEALNALRERVAQLDAIARSQAERIAELGQRLREKDELLDGLKHNAEQAANHSRPARPQAPASAPNGLLSERPVQPDRLQAIAGIGPVLERVLNELGIYRFGQLARLTPDNIEWLASRIDWFPQRIQREDWVGQARRLHREVHPDEEP
jgi:NADH-quinone oxidoreductase subunit E